MNRPRSSIHPSNVRAGACATVLSLLGVTACNLIDDEPEIPPDGTSGDDGNAVCIEVAEAVVEQCEAPQQFWFEFDGPTYNMLLIDDPSIVVDVLNGLLLNVGAGADYLGWYKHEGQDCGVYCGWCQPGQSMCLSGFDASGAPECMLCMDPSVDQQSNCEDWLSACAGVDETGSGTAGADETGGDADGGADETGGDGGGAAPYDCGWWDPTGAVSFDRWGRVYVDAGVVDDIVEYYGHPLSACDGTLFAPTASGHFKVQRLATGGLLYQMGLRAGDVLVQANGVELDTLDAIADMTVDLFYSTPATWFTLTYERQTTTQQLTIVLE